MDIGSILIGLAALLLVAFLIGQPLLDQRQQREAKLSEADRLRDQRDRILVTLRDLDFDHASGKIQEEDYAMLRAKLVADGAAIMKQLDEQLPASPIPAGVQAPAGSQISPEPASADEIERAIAARRHGAAVSVSVKPAPAPAASADEIERAIAARRGAQAQRGAQSRPPRPAESGEKIYCSQCGQAALAGDKFCAKCGAKLPSALSTKDSA